MIGEAAQHDEQSVEITSPDRVGAGRLITEEKKQHDGSPGSDEAPDKAD